MDFWKEYMYSHCMSFINWIETQIKHCLYERHVHHIYSYDTQKYVGLSLDMFQIWGYHDFWWKYLFLIQMISQENIFIFLTPNSHDEHWRYICLIFGLGMVVSFNMCITKFQKHTVAMSYYSKFFRMKHHNVITQSKFSA